MGSEMCIRDRSPLSSNVLLASVSSKEVLTSLIGRSCKTPDFNLNSSTKLASAVESSDNFVSVKSILNL